MPPDKSKSPPGGSRPPNGQNTNALGERGKGSTVKNPEQQTREVARRMRDLFRASDRSHVTYRLGSERVRNSDGKIVPEYRTVKKPVTVDLWRQHLAGKRPLSVAPACDDGTSRCSGVDVDDYGMNVLDIASTVRTRKLPFFVRPSKSFGAHVFAFHDVPIPTADAEAFARAMAVDLGITSKVDPSKIEYFPKVQGPDSLPICVNMPFFDGGGGFVKVTGAQMTVTEFLHMAEQSLVSAEHRGALLRSLPPVRRRRFRADNPKPSAASPATIDADLADKMAADRGRGNSTNPKDLPKPRKYKDDLLLELWWALTAIPPDIDRKTWLRIGAGIYKLLGEEGFELWNEWSRRGKKYDPETMQHDWIQARDKFRNQNVKAVFGIADDNDPHGKWRERYDNEMLARENTR